MKKYINADLLKAELEDLNESERLYYMGVFDVINSQPAADVVEVKHGKWLMATAFEVFGGEEQAWGKNPIAMIWCSNCRKEPYIDKNFLAQNILKSVRLYRKRGKTCSKCRCLT